MKRIILSLFIATFVWGVAVALPLPDTTRTAIQQTLQNYYQAMEKGDWPSVSKTLYLPDDSSRKANQRQYQTMFEMAKQKIESLDITSIQLSPDGQMAEARLRITGTMIRFDNEDQYDVDRSLVAMLHRTSTGWSLMTTFSANQYDAQRRLKATVDAEQIIRKQSQLAWIQKQDPLIAKKTRLDLALQIRLSARQAGTLEVMLPANTLLDAGDVVASAPPAELDIQIEQAVQTLEDAQANHARICQSIRKGTSTIKALDATDKVLAAAQQALQSLTDRRVLAMNSTPLPGLLTTQLAKAGATINKNQPIAGIVCHDQKYVLCFLRIGDEETTILKEAAPQLRPEQFLYALQIVSQPKQTLYAQPLAVLEDPDSSDMDIVLAIDVKQIQFDDLEKPMGVGLILPPEELCNPPFPDELNGYGVILDTFPIKEAWLDTVQAKVEITSWKAGDN